MAVSAEYQESVQRALDWVEYTVHKCYIWSGYNWRRAKRESRKYRRRVRFLPMYMITNLYRDYHDKSVFAAFWAINRSLL